jgi:hypothetical protein
LLLGLGGARAPRGTASAIKKPGQRRARGGNQEGRTPASEIRDQAGAAERQRAGDADAGGMARRRP